MRRLLTRAAVIVAATSVTGAADMPPKEFPQYDVPPKEWRTYLASSDTRALSEARKPGPFADISGGIVRAKDGSLEVLRMGLAPDLLAPRTRIDPGGVRYPPLREGDLIPGFNAQVCEVGRLEVPRRGEPATFTFATVPKPPPGTGLRRGGWAVPIKQAMTDYGGLLSNDKDGDWRVWVDAVTVPDKGPPAADLSLDLRSWPQLSKATVRAGDVLRYGDHALRVTNVVPRNPKTRVIGWVEFDGKPLTPDEAEKAAAESGGRVVVPVAPSS